MPIVAGVLALAACGASEHPHMPSRASRGSGNTVVTRTPGGSPAAARRSALKALVTAPTEDRLLVVAVPNGRVVGRVTLPGEPQFLAPNWGPPLVVSLAPGNATIVTGPPLRPTKTFAGFAAAPAVSIWPGDGYAWLTDARSGTLTVVGLNNEKVLARLTVGAGAHHLAFSPGGDQAWIALGEAAKTIAILSAVVANPAPPSSPVIDPGRPHLVGRFDPGFRAHDLAFSPDGKQVWITSANTTFTGVFGARTHRLLFRVPAGPPPQHVAIADGYAYITSGYGSRIEQVALNDGRVLRQASAPYGSFDLAAREGYVVTVSLLRGTLAIYNQQLRLLHVRHLAASLKDVVLTGS